LGLLFSLSPCVPPPPPDVLKMVTGRVDGLKHSVNRIRDKLHTPYQKLTTRTAQLWRLQVRLKAVTPAVPCSDCWVADNLPTLDSLLPCHNPDSTLTQS